MLRPIMAYNTVVSRKALASEEGILSHHQLRPFLAGQQPEPVSEVSWPPGGPASVCHNSSSSLKHQAVRVLLQPSSPADRPFMLLKVHFTRPDPLFTRNSRFPRSSRQSFCLAVRPAATSEPQERSYLDVATLLAARRAEHSRTQNPIFVDTFAQRLVSHVCLSWSFCQESEGTVNLHTHPAGWCCPSCTLTAAMGHSSYQIPR